MQIRSLRVVSYRSWKIDGREYSQTAKERDKKLELYQRLRADGCKEETALEAVGLSRASYFCYRKAYRSQGKLGLEPRSRCPRKRRQANGQPCL